MADEVHKGSARIGAARWLAATAVLGAAAGTMFWGAHALLPEESACARGLRIGGATIGAGESARSAADAAARRLLDRRFSFTWNGQPVLTATLAELGGSTDAADVARRAAAVGHEEPLIARIDSALEARRGHLDFPVRASIPVEVLAARLERIKDEHDEPPRAAKLDLATKTASAHAPGRYLDVYAAASALDRALSASGDEVAVPVFEIAPSASREVVERIDTSQAVSRFETRFGDGPTTGRGKNIRRAVSQIEGVVLMPGETVSFNANVGARSTDNGFFIAPEIYKGELREGIGGGTCQVSGTLHAAAYFGGMEIVERSSHSRPSGYIRPGLDATVVFPTVDLKLRNPYDFPIVIHATIDKGALIFELLGKSQPAKVELATETVGTADYKRKLEEVAGLDEGKVIVKQKGIRGLSLRKTRTIHLHDGREKVEITTDVYPPTFEILKVSPGTDPESLPPLPQDKRTAENEAAPSVEGKPGVVH
ncbi:MAG: VanW family protein [Minicystis sp.]